MVSVYSAPYREERTGDEWYTPMGPTDGKRWAPHRAPAVPRSGDDGHSQGHTDGNDGHPQGPHGPGTMGTPKGPTEGERWAPPMVPIKERDAIAIILDMIR